MFKKGQLVKCADGIIELKSYLFPGGGVHRDCAKCGRSKLGNTHAWGRFRTHRQQF